MEKKEKIIPKFSQLPFLIWSIVCFFCRFDISGYPTLKYKKDGQWIDFEGPREAQGKMFY